MPVWLPLVACLGGCCGGPPRGVATPPCRAPTTAQRCPKGRCATLDERLLAARQPMMRCIAKAGAAMQVGKTHRCFRALRLLESARWWLRTLEAHLTTVPKVYRIPVETIRQQFYCRLEHLAAAKTPREVERRYLEMVRSYP